MKRFEYTIHDESGLHARPAGMLVKEARNWQSHITLTANGKTADATKLLALMTMGIRYGTSVTLEVEGPDEEACALALQDFFSQNMSQSSKTPNVSQ